LAPAGVSHQANVIDGSYFSGCLESSFVIPITPGNIGFTQATSVFLLGTFGVRLAYALTYSIGPQGAIQLMIISL
jgi:uncharacterized membrane protein YbhN (UPF0104 family)